MIGFTLMCIAVWLLVSIPCGFRRTTEALIIKFHTKEHPGHFEFTVQAPVVVYVVGMIGLYLSGA